MYPPRTLAAPALLVALVLAAPAALAAPPSPKDKADARALVNDAHKALKDKRLPDAIGAFKHADQLDPSPALELELAQAQVSAGKLVDAINMLFTIAASTDEAYPSKKAREAANKALADLKPRIPTVRVTVTGPTGKATVTLDGVEIDASGDVMIDPGAHTFGASADGFKAGEKPLTLAEGKHETLEIALQPDAPAPPPASTTGSRLPGILVTSGGGLLLILGGVFGGLAFSATSSAKAQCTGDLCPPSALGDINQSRTFGNVSTGMFIAGGAVAAAGIALTIIAPGGSSSAAKSARARVVPWIGAGQAGIAGTF
jgi:hypothetical protein